MKYNLVCDVIDESYAYIDAEGRVICAGHLDLVPYAATLADLSISEIGALFSATVLLFATAWGVRQVITFVFNK